MTGPSGHTGRGRRPSFHRLFVPNLYRRAGRGGIFGFFGVLFSVTYRWHTPVERTIPSLATTVTHLGRVQRHSDLSQVAYLCTFLLWAYPAVVDVVDSPILCISRFPLQQRKRVAIKRIPHSTVRCQRHSQWSGKSAMGLLVTSTASERRTPIGQPHCPDSSFWRQPR